MLADAPADVRAAVEGVKRAFPGAELVSVQRVAPEPVRASRRANS